jgi:hypothetical protein
VNFLSDTAFLYRSDTIYGRYKGNISQRNSGLSYGDVFGNHPIIIANGTNSVAITVLPDAPIDHVTQLPVPTIAVGTDAGVSIIKHDGTVVDWTKATGPYCHSVAFRKSDNALCVTFDINATTKSRFRHVLHKIPDSDKLETTFYYQKSGSDEMYTQYSFSAYSGTSLALSSNVNMKSAKWLGDADAGISQLSLISPNQAEPTKGMLAAITSKYNTGWMVGGIRGAWLSDTAEGNLVGGELVTNGDFAVDSGWLKGTGWTISGGIATHSPGAGSDITQSGVLVAGATYIVSFEVVSVRAATILYVNSNTGYQIVEEVISTGIKTAIFTAPSTGNMGIRIGGQGDVDIDNISVKLAIPDRSFNNKALIVNGTLTRTQVAGGGNLVWYGGWSAANYLSAGYDADFNFGTGGFCIYGWLKLASNSAVETLLDRDSASTAQRFTVDVDAAGKLRFTCDDNTTTRTATSVAVVDNSVPVMFHAVYDGAGGVHIYLDGRLDVSATGAALLTLNNATAILHQGVKVDGTLPLTNGELLNLRVSATVPTANQIQQMYTDELAMLSLPSTLYGTSDDVTALAHDAGTDELHAGTSSGRSTFKGLVRVANTTTPVTTAIAAGNGMVVSQ